MGKKSKLRMWHTSTTQKVTKLKNSKCDKTKQKSKFDKHQILIMWHKKKLECTETQKFTKIKNSNMKREKKFVTKPKPNRIVTNPICYIVGL